MVHTVRLGLSFFLRLFLDSPVDCFAHHWQIIKAIALGDSSLVEPSFIILGLIAAAGLPDRLLRNQLREVLENKSWASKSN